MNGKKTIAVLIALAIALAGAGGCKKAGATNAAGNSETKPTLKALVNYKSGMDYNNYPVQKYLEQATGYKVQYDVLPADSPNDKLNAIMASGESYDYIQIWDKTEYSNLAQQGALTDLKPLIKQYGPNITKSISSALWEIVAVNGAYTAVPTITASGRKDKGNVKGGIVIRSDLLEKMGLSMPKTISDFENILQQVKDKDPNGQGNKNIPLTTDKNIDLRSAGLGGAFGVTTDWSAQNGKLVPACQTAGFKSYIQFLRDLYTKGLLDKEAPTNTSTTAKQKFTNGNAFAFVDNWSDFPELMTTLAKTQPNAKIKFLAPVSGNYGKAQEGAASINSIDNFSVVPKSSKHAADVVKYFNLKLQNDIFKNMTIGAQNVDYTVKDGAYYPISPAFFNDRGNSNMFLSGATSDYSTYWLCRVRKDDNLYEGWKELNIDYIDTAVVDPAADLPCSIYSSVASAQQTLTTLTNQFIIQSAAGNYSDSTYNAFLTQWKSQGGDSLVKTVNEWYASSKKSK